MVAMRSPLMNNRAAQRLRAGQTIQAQQLAGQVAAGAAPAPAAPALDAAGAAIAKQAASQATQAAAQQGQLATNQAKLAEGQAAAAAQTAQGQRAAGMEETARANEDRLARLSLDTKRKLLDDRVKFETDEVGRSKLNALQVADWAVTSAESAEDFKDKMQTMELAQNRKIQLMETAYQRIMAELKSDAEAKTKKLTYEQRIRLEQYASQMKEAFRREQANKANTQMIFTAAGGAAGAAFGGPAGYAIGSGLGGMAGATATRG